MNLFLILSLLSLLIPTITDDPDLEICSVSYLSAAVYTDDNQSYIFNGKYYWKTRSLDKETGIIGFASLVSDKWPEIDDKIKTVFTIPDRKSMPFQLVTVFVVKDKWLAYNMGKKFKTGTTESWPGFKDLVITAAFASDLGESTVFILHSDNKNYTLYNFTSLDTPVKLRSGPTTMRGSYLWFLEAEVVSRRAVESTNEDSEPLVTLKDIINVKAAMTYARRLILISNDFYCFVKLNANPFEKGCIPRPDQRTTNLLNCPLDIGSRPSTKATNTKNPVPTVDITSFKIGPGHQRPTEAPNNVDYGVVKTGIPVLGDLYGVTEDSGNIKTNKTYELMANEVEFIEKQQKDSNYWGIAFIIGLIIIAICALLTVGVVYRVVNSNKVKGNVIYVK